MSWRVEHGDCLEVLAAMPECSIDAVVTDPPYGIGFMGHEWDQPGDHGPLSAGHGGCNVSFAGPPHPAMEAGRYDLSRSANARFAAWTEAWARALLRVLKPGGFLVSFGGTRTYHRLVVGIEDAGFEVRDQLCWLFGSGFPKSLNLTGDRQGWGTALKPGHEPIVLARKPLVGTVAANVAEHGTGALNVDGCRVGSASTTRERTPDDFGLINDDGWKPTPGVNGSESGRWPANVVLDEEAGAMLDEQSGELVSGANPTRRGTDKFRDVYGDFAGQEECAPARGVDVGGASRFYYCAKTSRAERDAGLDGFEKWPLNWSNGEQNPGSFQSDGTEKAARNSHPTVKPIDLMRWLVRLITPPGGKVLDPFTGSGTTGGAAVLEGFDFVGVEREAEYVAIATARIGWWADQPAGVDVDQALAGEARRRGVADTGQLGLLATAAEGGET